VITYYDCDGDVICEQFQFGGTCSPTFNPTNCVQLQACPPIRTMARAESNTDTSKKDAHAVDMWVSPNPLYTRSRVEYFLPEPSQVLLQLHDMNGNLVQTLQTGTLTKGFHNQILETSTMPAGMYFLVLTIGSETVVKRVVVLK